jgi:Txe/YoeB family toxin of Txe-Axe toxin-antitoxin module
MGDGNYHLFGERAGEEKGAYLSKPHATILSSHPLFKRNAKDIDVEPECKFRDLKFESGNKEYIVSGRVESNLPAYAVVAYHDLMQHHVDYDATSWVSEVDKDGRFRVRVGALKPGWYELRLRCYFVNGAREEIAYQFTLDDSLKIPVEKLARQTIYQLHAEPAIAARDPAALRGAIEKLEGMDDVWYRRAQAYHRLMTRPEVEQKELSTVGDDVREVPLATIKWESAAVGWEQPACNYVSGADMPLESGERFHETGIYAHADSRYVYRLGGKWKKFISGYGLQNLHEGSVVFVVKCDGQEKFRSDLVRGWKEGQVEVDLTGVDTLELIVEDGGDGKWADCGIWFSPQLAR